MQLTLKRRFIICLEVLFASSEHSHSAQEEELPIYMRGYNAGIKDVYTGLDGTKAKQYDALLEAVTSKAAGETRFETVLKYIKRCEEQSPKACDVKET